MKERDVGDGRVVLSDVKSGGRPRLELSPKGMPSKPEADFPVQTRVGLLTTMTTLARGDKAGDAIHYEWPKIRCRYSFRSCDDAPYESCPAEGTRCTSSMKRQWLPGYHITKNTARPCFTPTVH